MLKLLGIELAYKEEISELDYLDRLMAEFVFLTEHKAEFLKGNPQAIKTSDDFFEFLMKLYGPILNNDLEDNYFSNRLSADVFGANAYLGKSEFLNENVFSCILRAIRLQHYLQVFDNNAYRKKLWDFYHTSNWKENLCHTDELLNQIMMSCQIVSSEHDIGHHVILYKSHGVYVRFNEIENQFEFKFHDVKLSSKSLFEVKKILKVYEAELEDVIISYSGIVSGIIDTFERFYHD